MLLPIVTVWLAAAGSSWATDYYVSPSGNDSNPGTSVGTGAWQTTSKVNVHSFAAGDRILFEGGQTFGGSLGFGSDDTGSAANPIIVTSYGGGRATINGGTGKGIVIYNTAGISVSDLYVVGAWNAATQSGNTGNGIELFTDIPGGIKLDSISINNVAVLGFKLNGIIIGGYPADGSKSGWKNVLIRNSEAYNNGGAGISSFGYFSISATTYAHENIVVRDCKAYSNRGLRDTAGNSGNGIVLGDVNGAIIERCLAYDNGDLNNSNFEGPVGIWTYDSNDVSIQFNESYSNKSGNSIVDGGGFDLDGGVTNSTMQYNYSHGNSGPGYLIFQYSGARPLMAGNTVRYNISENDGRGGHHGGIWIGGGAAVQANRIYNNTIYLSPAPGGMPTIFTNLGVGSGNSACNNIFQTSGGALLINSSGAMIDSLLLQGNNYWPGGSAFSVKWGATTYSTLAAWRSATQQEKSGGFDTGFALDPLLGSPGNGSTIANPALLNQLSAYRLNSTSPMINSGLDLFALYGESPGSRDFHGGTLPQGGAYDIGANEFAAITILTGPAASPNPVTHGSTGLAVTATTAVGEADLIYTWGWIGTPPAPVIFSVNGTNAAKNTTASFSKSGAYQLSVTITNSGAATVTGNLPVTVNQTFEFWLTEHGLTGADAQPSADPYGVGISNLLAYGLGIEPQAANPQAGLPALHLPGGELVLNYQAPRTDLIYQPEWSTNLAEWQTSGITIVPNGDVRSASVPRGTDPGKFIRLRVSR